MAKSPVTRHFFVVMGQIVAARGGNCMVRMGRGQEKSGQAGTGIFRPSIDETVCD
jgi:hypothetical protein